jgi:hypothetical protein
VAAVVQANLAYLRLAEEGFPRLPVGVPVDRLSRDLGEDEIVVLPERAAGEALRQFAARCAFSDSTSWLGSAKLRRLRSDFGSS